MAVAGFGPEALLLARIEVRVEELARVLARAWREGLPDCGNLSAEFGSLPPDLRNPENGRAARQAIRLFLAAMRGSGSGGEAPPGERDEHGEAERASLLRQTARLAEAGVPLATHLAAYEICGRVMFDALRESALPHEQEALLDAAAVLLRANAQIASDVAQIYQNERAGIGSAERDRRRALVRDLLVGITPVAPTQLAELLAEFRFDEGAVVLAVSLADEPPHQPARGLRAVEDAIEQYFGHPVPMLLEADGGHVLVPHASLPAPQGPALDEIAARIGEIRHTARVAAASASAPAGFAAAARAASEVVRLAGRLRRPAGAHRLADVLLEYHLTRRDESADLLDGLLAPLAERPELLETVRVYLEENYDRRRAARRLSLHPNTVDNRLARTTELTGLDPSTPRGVTLLMTALALRDLS